MKVIVNQCDQNFNNFHVINFINFHNFIHVTKFQMSSIYHYLWGSTFIHMVSFIIHVNFIHIQLVAISLACGYLVKKSILVVAICRPKFQQDF
jgi:hypothetical protein